MEKASFISGRALKTLLVIALLIGAGIGAYFIFKPKADLDAPYEIFYEYSTNEKIKEINSKYVDDVISKMKTCKEDSKTIIPTKNEITVAISKIELLQEILSYDAEYDEIFLDSFSFAEMGNGKLANRLKELEKSYDNLVEKANTCYDYYNTYLTLEYNDNARVWQLISGTNGGFCESYNDYAKCLTDFYCKVANIYDGYIKDQFKANQFSKKNFKVISLWVNELANQVVNKPVAISDPNTALEKSDIYAKVNYLKNEYDSHNSLYTFKSNNKIKETQYFGVYDEEQKKYTETKVNYDKILKAVDNVNLNDCVSHLVANNYGVFANSIEDKETKKLYETLGKDYFFVM